MVAAKKKSASTAVVSWDDELAKQAEIAAKMEASAAGGQFFSLRGGVLTWQDAPLPKNQMAVVIIDSILENCFYEDKFDPDNPSTPVCFAFGRDDKELKPHQVVVEAGNAQHDFCAGCEQNEWGSADIGRGKACRNTRRLAMVPAGSFDAAGKLELINDPAHYASVQVGYLKLPVTSVKGYASFVKQVSGALNRPPHGIVTRVRVEPDPKSQFRVLFEPLIKIPNELIPAVMQRHEEVSAVIDFPYVPFEEDEKPAAKKPAAKKQQPAGRGKPALKKRF